MENWISTIFLAIASAATVLVAPLWLKYVGWHLPIRIHRQLVPLLMVPLVIAAVFFYLQVTTLGILTVGFGTMLFLFFFKTIGAKCPDCGDRLRSHRHPYGPLLYLCDACDYRWSSWESDRHD